MSLISTENIDTAFLLRMPDLYTHTHTLTYNLHICYSAIPEG